MRTRRLFQALSTILLAGAILVPTAEAAGKKKKKEEPAAEPVALEQPINYEPKGIAFGKGRKDVLDLYDKVIDKDYLDEYQKVEPGVQMRRLEEEIQRKKDVVRNSYIALDKPPSNLDGSKFVGEFSYGNKEGVLRVERLGKKRTLFFIQDKLWKIVDVYELGEKSKWGADFKSAAAKLEGVIGVPGRMQPAAPDQGRPNDEVDWADAKVHLRAINWGSQLAIAYVDRATEARLPELRKNKPQEKEDLDPKTKEVLR